MWFKRICELLGDRGTHFRDGNVDIQRLKEVRPRLNERGSFIASNLIEYAEETRAKAIEWEHFIDILRFFSTGHVIEQMERCYKQRKQTGTFSGNIRVEF